MLCFACFWNIIKICAMKVYYVLVTVTVKQFSFYVYADQLRALIS